MAKNMRVGADNKRINKKNIYLEFVRWSALPHFARIESGATDQKGFAKQHGVSEDTLTRWKQRPGFEPEIEKLTKSWGLTKTPDVLHSIYRSAVKGSGPSQKLWLQYFKDFSPRGGKRGSLGEDIFIAEGDIRGLIEMLPEPLKSEHYANLRKLLDDSAAYRDSNPDDPMWEERSTSEEL